MSKRSKKRRKKQKREEASQKSLDEILGPPPAPAPPDEPEPETPTPTPAECPLCDGSTLDADRRCSSCGSVVHGGPRGDEVTLRGEVLRSDDGSLMLRLMSGLVVPVALDARTTRILHRRFVRPARAMRPGDEVLAAGRVGVHFDEHQGSLREASVHSFTLQARLLSVGTGRERLLWRALHPDREKAQKKAQEKEREERRRRIVQKLERFQQASWNKIVFLFPLLCLVTCVWTPACPLVCSYGPLDDVLERANRCSLLTDRLGPDVGCALYGCSNVDLACACEEDGRSRASLPVSGDRDRGRLYFSYYESSDRVFRATVRTGDVLIDVLSCRVVFRYGKRQKRRRRQRRGSGP